MFSEKTDEERPWVFLNSILNRHESSPVSFSWGDPLRDTRLLTLFGKFDLSFAEALRNGFYHAKGSRGRSKINTL